MTPSFMAISALWSTTVLVAGCSLVAKTPDGADPDWNCPALPSDFDRSWLIGKWEARYGAAIDAITLVPDGTYQQRYARTSDGYQFENGPHDWSLEERPGGGFYLHLSEMRRCDDTDELCATNTGGSGERHWYDFCGRQFVSMPEEVILLVTGAQDIEGIASPPLGVMLRHMAIDSTSGSFSFIRSEP